MQRKYYSLYQEGQKLAVFYHTLSLLLVDTLLQHYESKKKHVSLLTATVYSEYFSN